MYVSTQNFLQNRLILYNKITKFNSSNSLRKRARKLNKFSKTMCKNWRLFTKLNQNCHKILNLPANLLTLGCQKNVQTTSLPNTYTRFFSRFSADFGYSRRLSNESTGTLKKHPKIRAVHNFLCGTIEGNSRFGVAILLFHPFIVPQIYKIGDQNWSKPARWIKYDKICLMLASLHEQT